MGVIENERDNRSYRDPRTKDDDVTGSVGGGGMAGVADRFGKETGGDRAGDRTAGTAVAGVGTPAQGPVPGDTVGQPTNEVSPFYHPPQAAATGTEDKNSIISRLMDRYGKDIDWLGGKPFSSTEEQQVIEEQASGIRNKYDTARENLRNSLGSMQGMSGVLAGEMGKLEQAESAEMSGLHRQLGIAGIGEQRSRREEARGILGGLEGLERTRTSDAMGIEGALDEQDRGRLFDLVRLIQGLSPDGSNMAELLGKQAESAGNRSAAGMSGLGNLAQLYYMTK